jgi:membrane protein YdbS with pleckstrin-like domain
VTLVDPAHPPSRKAPLAWAIGAGIPWLIAVLAQLVWIALDGRVVWLHVLAAAVTTLGIVAFVVVAPLWRYRVHRWDISLESGPPAVYTRTGWITQERRIAPMSRVQTVDTYRGPLDVVRAGQRDRHRGDRRRGRHGSLPTGEGHPVLWQRLSPRMLLVHPVQTPCTQDSVITACNALSMRRRRSSSERKNDPTRSLGILTSMSPEVVETVLARCPLRWVPRSSDRW